MGRGRGWELKQIFGGGGSFRSGIQSPTGAKQSFAGRIPKRRLGTTETRHLGTTGEKWYNSTSPAAVAQLVEQLICNQLVGSSNLFGGTTI